MNCTLTEYGYQIFKYEYYYDFLNIVTKLENLENYLEFDFNMIM